MLQKIPTPLPVSELIKTLQALPEGSVIMPTRVSDLLVCELESPRVYKAVGMISIATGKYLEGVQYG